MTLIGEECDTKLSKFNQIPDQIEDLVLIGTNQQQINAMSKKNIDTLEMAKYFQKQSKLDKLILHYQFHNQHYKIINEHLLNKKTAKINHLILYKTRMQPLNFKALTSLTQLSIIASIEDEYEIDGEKLRKLYKKCPDLNNLRLPYYQETGIIDHITSEVVPKETFKMRVYYEDQAEQQKFHFTPDNMTVTINSSEENEIIRQFAAKRKFKEIKVMLNDDIDNLFCYTQTTVTKLTILVTRTRLNQPKRAIETVSNMNAQVSKKPMMELTELTLHCYYRGDGSDVKALRDSISGLRTHLPKLEKLEFFIYFFVPFKNGDTIHSFALDVCESTDTDSYKNVIRCSFRK